jgi:general secretion pathway protein J
MTPGTTDRGVSLLELVAVMAIFSLVAVMALNLLSAGLKAQTRIAASSTDVPEITAALAVMRRDLEGMQPVSLSGTGTSTGFGVTDGTPGLSLVTVSAGDGWSIDWKLADDGTLMRTARPFGESDAGGEAVIMAHGFSELSVRVADAAGIWRVAIPLRPDEAADLPRGIAVDLIHDTLGLLPLVVAR